MNFLQEALSSIRRLEDEPTDELPSDDTDELSLDDPDEVPSDELSDEPSDDMDLSLDDPDEVQDSEHPELDGIADDASDDPDRQGLIRTVKGAHLVYKRDTEEGSFEELWIYNVSTLRDELIVKKAILAGTDIPTNKTQSPDGSQSYEIWSAGNAEMLLVKGLPN